MGDYLPQADAAFDKWVKNFLGYLPTHLADFGLVAADITLLTAAGATWSPAFAANTPAQAAAASARQAKDDARSGLETQIRLVVKGIQARPKVTDAAKAALQITVKDTTPTDVAPPSTAPVGKVDTSKRLEHTIEFFDSATPKSHAKPAGVRGCQIWVKVGNPAPVAASELHYLATDTRSPYVAQYDGADGGKQAHYWLRWENTHAETGPWSACVSATIGG